MADDIPGTPGVRSIGGQPLSDAASDDGGDSGGGGGDDDNGSGGDGGHDDVVAGEFTGDEVRESIETGQSLEEVNTPADAEGEDDGGDSSSNSSSTEIDRNTSQSSQSSALATGGGAAVGPNTTPAGVAKDPESQSGTTDSGNSSGSSDGTPNLPGNPNLDRTEVPEWVQPDDNPRGSIDTAAAPQTAGDQFRYQEFRDLERAPKGTIARGLTGDELRASMQFQRELQSNTNREDSERLDDQVSPNEFRPEQDTTQAEATKQQLKEQTADKFGFISEDEVTTDVQQTEQGAQITTGLTEQGQAELQQRRRRARLAQAAQPFVAAAQQKEQRLELESNLEQQLGEDIQREDYQLQQTDGGLRATLSDSFKREQAAELVKQANPNAESVIGRRSFSGLKAGEHFTVTQTNGSSSIELTSQGREIVARTLAQTKNPDADTELARKDLDGTLKVDDQGQITGVEQREQFGDVPLVDDALSDAGQFISNKVISPAASGVANAAGTVADYTLPGDTKAQQRGINIGEKMSKNALEGAGETVNIPATTAGLIEVGEFGGEAAAETVQGDGGEYAAKTKEAAVTAGGRAVEQATEKPLQTGAAVGGSLIASAGIMGLASKSSSTAAAASRYAIQPGEELAGLAGNKALSAVPRVGSRAARAAFPNNEPVIFSEEAAIRGARAAARKAKSANALVRGETSLSPSPRQAELIDLGRPGSSTGTFSVEGESDTGALGATSEPLGSDTESILDATTTETREGIQDPSDSPASAIDEFLADTRGQLDFAQEQRQRPDTNPATEPEIDPSRRRDDLLEGSPRDRLSSDITSRQQEMRRQAEGTFEGEQDPVGEAEQRRQAAVEPEARIDSSEMGAIRRAEAVAPQSDTLTLNDTLGGTRSDGLFDNLLDIDAGTDTRTDLDQVSETVQETETEAETEAEAELELVQETETKREFEREAKAEFATESRLEFMGEGGEEEPRREATGGAGGFTSRDRTSENALTSGYFNEFVTAVGTGGRARSAPSQSELEAAASDRVTTTALPTLAQLEGNENVEAAEDLFAGFGGDSGGGLL